MLKKLITLHFLLVCVLTAFTQDLFQFSGRLVDSKTNVAIPYATVSLQKSLIGTVTNENGEFELMIPDSIEGDSLIFRYLGYIDRKFAAKKDQLPLVVKLEANSFTLKEVIVTPMPPEYYIKRAVSKLPINLPNESFETYGYFSEKIKENGEFLKHNEAVFKTYYPAFQDTLPFEHQLILYRKEKKIKEMAFMKKQIEKEAAKERKKAEKKGKEYEEEDMLDLDGLLGGPEDILKASKLDEKIMFLDSNSKDFEKFIFTFGTPTTYHGKEVLVINFKNKKKVEHTRFNGTVYIDLKSDAIVALDYTGVVHIPITVKPILFMMGFSLENPTVTVKQNYREVNGKWYPSHTTLKLNLNVTKRHLFTKNEFGNFEFDQVFAVSKYGFENLSSIPKEKQFDPKEDYEKQVHNDIELKWSDVNVMKK